MAAAEGAGVAVEAIVYVGVGETETAGFGVVTGVARGVGVALGTSNRPRRCDAVGKGAADDTGAEVVAGAGDCSNGVALRGVIVGSGFDVVAAGGAGVADIAAADIVAAGDGVVATDVDEVDVSEL